VAADMEISCPSAWRSLSAYREIGMAAVNSSSSAKFEESFGPFKQSVYSVTALPMLVVALFQFAMA
jgi:hypothetical protein